MRTLAFTSAVLALVLAVFAAVQDLLDGGSPLMFIPAAALLFAVVIMWIRRDLITVLVARLGALATVITAAVNYEQIGWAMALAAVLSFVAAVVTSIDVRVTEAKEAGPK